MVDSEQLELFTFDYAEQTWTYNLTKQLGNKLISHS
jgi:hypothetical protein